MPTNLRCDACLAVVYQLYTALFVEQSKLDKSKKRKSLKEYEILETIENVCNKNFEEYGVKQVDGLNRLSGPGLETQGVMGMTQMGGRWPHRLQEMCHYYIGEAGEFDIYEMFLEGKSKLTEFLCYGKGTYGHCAQLKSSTKTEL
nr:marginal zone B- and B1-cell-specific protein isoform X2 [Parasteatoda tepidariorum]